MKKLHGTHSIQPLTITDAVVAEDANIAESKVALTYTTTDLHDYASDIDQRLSEHEDTSSDPHGQILTQTTIRSEDIQSAPSPVQQTITVTNAGDGNVLLDIDGDIKADNATLNGDVNISGVTSIGGQTHISGSVVIDGDLTVVGTTTKVESETIDYDSLLVTPSSALNHTGIVVAPDGTGWEEGSQEPIIETTTVHDDLLNCYASRVKAVKELSDHDLVFLFENRIVRTNSGVSEIKYTANAGEDELFEYIATDENDNIYVIFDDMANEVVKVKKFDSELHTIETSSALKTSENRSIALHGVCDFEYLNGRFYITLIDNTLNYCDNAGGLSCFDTLSPGTNAESITGNSSSLLYSCIPFVDPESENTYICCICSDSIYLLDSAFTVASTDVFGSLTGMGAPAEFFQQTFFDPVAHSIFVLMGKTIALCADILPFLSGEQDLFNCNPTSSSGTTDFDDMFANVSYLGATDSGLFIFFSASEPELEWVDSSILPALSFSEEPEAVSVVANTRATASLAYFPAAILRKEGAGFFTEDKGTVYFIGDTATAVQGGGGSPEYIQRLDPDSGVLGSATRVVRRSTNEALYHIDPIGYYEPAVRAIEVFPDNNALGIIEKDETYLPLADMTDGTWDRLYTTQLDGYKAVLHPAGCIVRNDEKQLVFLTYNYTQNSSPVWEVRTYATDASAEKLNTIGIQQLLSSAEPDPAHAAISADGNWLYFTAYETGEEIPDSDEDYVKTLKLIGVNLNATGELSASSNDVVVLSPDLASSNISSTYNSGTETTAIAITSDDRAVLAISSYSYDSVSHMFQPTTTHLAEVDLSDGSILSVKNMGSNFIHNMLVYDDNIFIGTSSINPGAVDPVSDNTILKADISTPGSVGTASFIDIAVLNSSDGSVDVIRTETTETEIEPEGDTFTGNLLELQTRTRGLNEAAVIVDRNGNLNILKGAVTIQGNKLDVTSNGINFTSDITAPSVTTTGKGFIYKANSAATPGSTVISCKDSSNNNLFMVGGNGNTSVGGTLTLGGASDPIYYDGNEYGTQADVAFTNNVVTLDDSVLTLVSGNNTPWKIFNTHSSVSFYFGVQNAPKFEISENEVTIAQPATSLQNLAVHGTSSFTGNVTVALNATVDGVDIGIHDHSGVAGHGERIPATSVIGLQEFLDGHMETVQDYVGGMVSSNTENGIAVTYDDNSGKLNFDVSDFTITAAGNVSGSATITNLGNSTFTMTVLDSDKVDGLHVTSGTVNNEANKVVKTDANGHTKCGWINTTSGDANTTTMDRVYASYDGYIRYYTPANFAAQILALGGTVKNSHVHDKVNNLKPLRGSSTFNGTTGRVVMLPAAFANTNYTVTVTPVANTNGQLGDVWVSKSTDRFTVYNTGSATVAFDYIAIG